MSFFQRCFVPFSGHTFDTRSGCEPEDYTVLSMLGVTVALASLLSGVNAGVAAWVYTEGSLMPIRVGLVAIAFLFVLTVVLTMDRQAIYAADTSLQMNPKLLALQLGCRVVFVLCIGAASSQAVLPLLLKAELRLTALEMREERGRQRTSNVEGQLDLNRKRGEARAGEKRIKELEAAQGSVPPDVARRLAAAEACRASVAAERQRIQQSGPMSSEQVQVMAGKAAHCRTRIQEAVSQRDRHQAKEREALDEARQAGARRDRTLSESEDEARRRIGEAGTIEDASLTERSADVLAETIRRNPGARAKWLILTALQLLLESLPLLMKLSAGQSIPGLMRAYRKRFVHLDLIDKESSQRHGADVKEGLQQAAALSAQQLAQSPAIQAVLREEFLRAASSGAAFRTFEEYVRQATEARDLRQQSVRRYPDLAEAISASYVEAVRRATEMMSRDMQAGTAR